jgi:hypothetical protein
MVLFQRSGSRTDRRAALPKTSQLGFQAVLAGAPGSGPLQHRGVRGGSRYPPPDRPSLIAVSDTPRLLNLARSGALPELAEAGTSSN